MRARGAGALGVPAAPQREPLWFSPALNAFRRTKPPTTCGGILAEDMGLGKTVITLALCLLNPAPTIEGEPTAAQLALWGTDADAADNIDNADGGVAPAHPPPVVLSRATLVVCPVSLVGQVQCNTGGRACDLKWELTLHACPIHAPAVVR